MNTILHFLNSPLNPTNNPYITWALCLALFPVFGAIYFGIIYLSEEFLPKQ